MLQPSIAVSNLREKKRVITSGLSVWAVLLHHYLAHQILLFKPEAPDRQTEEGGRIHEQDTH